MGRTVKYTRKVVIGLVGGIVLLAGLIMIPVPGPGGLPLTILGLFILSLEFDWFKSHLERTKKITKSAVKPPKKR